MVSYSRFFLCIPNISSASMLMYRLHAGRRRSRLNICLTCVFKRLPHLAKSGKISTKLEENVEKSSPGSVEVKHDEVNMMNFTWEWLYEKNILDMKSSNQLQGHLSNGHNSTVFTLLPFHCAHQFPCTPSNMHL